MAVIAEDSPAQGKPSHADIPMIAMELPTQEEGFSIDKSKKVFLPDDNNNLESDTDWSPPPDSPAEPPRPLPVQKCKKKRRKRKSRKMKAVVVIRGRRPKPGIFSGKFHLKLPKKAIGNRIFFIALCSCLQYHLAQSALSSMTSAPVSDVPMVLKQNDQNFIFQHPPSGPGLGSVCYRDKSLLEMFCSRAAASDIWVKPGNGDETLMRTTAGDCNHFVKKSHKQRMERSELNLGADQKVSDISVEEKHGNVTTIRSHDDTLRCTKSIPLSDSPIFLHQNDRKFSFRRPTFCPQRVHIFASRFACFQEISLPKIICSHLDSGEIWIEHGKGTGDSAVVVMSSAGTHGGDSQPG